MTNTYHPVSTLTPERLEKLRQKGIERYAKQMEAKEAARLACLGILRDPQTTAHDKFAAMRVLDRLLKINVTKTLTIGYRKKEVAIEAEVSRIPELSQEFVDEVMSTAQRELNGYGHQNEA